MNATTLRSLADEGYIVPDYYAAVIGIWLPEHKTTTINWLKENFGVRTPAGVSNTDCTCINFNGTWYKVTIGDKFKYPTAHFPIRVVSRDHYGLVISLLKAQGFNGLESGENSEREYWLGSCMSDNADCSIHVAWRTEESLPVLE